MHLNHHLTGVTPANYTEEQAKKTEGYGDCCMLTVLECGHPRNDFSEDVDDYDDEDHMDYEGEFSFQVNETCLHGNPKCFLISQEDRFSQPNACSSYFTGNDVEWIKELNSLAEKTEKKSRQKSKTEGQ